MAEYSVTLPCRIGDMGYGIRRHGGNRGVSFGAISEVYFVGEDMRLVVAIKKVCRGELGKNVFLTYDEAKAALYKERIKGGKE